LARSQICKLKFQSFAKNVQRFTLATLSSEFLVIPFGSSEPLKLEICINPHMVPPIFFLFSLLGFISCQFKSCYFLLCLEFIYSSTLFQIHQVFKCQKKVVSFSAFLFSDQFLKYQSQIFFY